MSIPSYALSTDLRFYLQCYLEKDFFVKECRRFTDQNGNLHSILEIPHAIKTELLELKQIKIGEFTCTIRTYLPARRCENCQSYSHNSSKCEFNTYCGNCAGNHKTKDCKNDNKLCINCFFNNKYYRTNYDIRHTVSDSCCEVFQYYKRKNTIRA